MTPRSLRCPPWLRVGIALLAAGYGANHFATLLLAYRVHDNLSETVVTAMFAAYATGLIPALIIAARVANRFGHRVVMRTVLIGCAVASIILAAGASSEPMLFAGRFLYGLAMGAAMAPGSTWVKELSADAPPGSGAKRAAMSLTAGFGLGPLITGVVAQWAPAPLVTPYLIHLVLVAIAAVTVWNAPLPARHEMPHIVAVGESIGPRHAITSREFWWRIAPMAPWVFGAACFGMLIDPVYARDSVAGAPLAFTGLLAVLMLGTGLLAQQPARAVEARRPGLVAVLGMGAVTVGMVLALVVEATSSPWWCLLAAPVFGLGYGWSLVGGLTRVEHLASADQLAMTNAVFYALTYLGFFFPTIIAAFSEHWPPRDVLLIFLAAAVASLIFAVAARRRFRLAQPIP